MVNILIYYDNIMDMYIPVEDVFLVRILCDMTVFYKQ
jgi:hypothetical protein